MSKKTADQAESVTAAAESAAAVPAQDALLPQSGDPVKARVLVACVFGQPNDVVEVAAAVAGRHPSELDADPSAVAYALTLVR
jgi:hypothetical protein